MSVASEPKPEYIDTIECDKAGAVSIRVVGIHGRNMNAWLTCGSARDLIECLRDAHEKALRLEGAVASIYGVGK